jgi:hypothetical protein
MKSDPFLDACRAEMPEKVKAIVDRRFLIADQIIIYGVLIFLIIFLKVITIYRDCILK